MADAREGVMCGSAFRDGDCVGGIQLGCECSGMLWGTFDGLRLWVSRFPGACWVEMLGDNGCLV